MASTKERWDFRVEPDTDELVRRAAESVDKTLTDFVVSAATIEAERVLADRTTFVLEPEQWATFIELLDRPERGNPGLDRLFSRPGLFARDEE
jgi:uncharacterized protein (DUF1778 family)